MLHTGKAGYPDIPSSFFWQDRWHDVEKLPQEKSPAELLDGIRALHDHLEQGVSIQWHGGDSTPEGFIEAPWPDYPDWLWYGIWDAITLLIDRLGVAPPQTTTWEDDRASIERAGLSELAHLFRWYGNGERICTGLIDEGATDGTLLAASKRLLELMDF